MEMKLLHLEPTIINPKTEGKGERMISECDYSHFFVCSNPSIISFNDYFNGRSEILKLGR
jgi:hypothetical protein